ncbi:MAG: hypothetical protein ABSE42_13820 [Bryobacteraceae bacterium]|jgi:hypothetical protein
MKIAAVLAFVLSASAQSYSAHSGWSFSDTLQTASDVLVADITGGSAVDSGSQVTVKATLHTVRVLSGDINAGADLALQWHYKPGPGEGPAVTTKVPQTRGLWFLRKNSDGALEPLQAGTIMTPMGGSFLPLGIGAPSYSDDERLQTKVAREIGTALEDLVAEHAADLGPYRPEPGGHWVSPSWTQSRSQYQSLTMALQSLDRPAATEVYQSLSMLPDANLKVLGIFGRLGGGDISAVFDLEKNLATVLSASAAVHPFPFPPFLGSLDLKANLAAAHALARIALSDTTVQGLDGQLAFALGRTGSPEMLPYMMVMLGSHHPSIRGGALMGICPLLRTGSTPSPFWSEEMAGYCPNAAPVNDRELEQKDIQFWTQWWESHRAEMAKTVALPNVAAPSRYGAAPPQVAEIPIEIRFEFLLHMATNKPPDHYHAADGTLVEGPPPGSDAPHDPVSGQLEAADREIFHQAIDSVNAKLADVQARSQQMMNAARIAGTMPDRQQSKALSADRQAALRTGLADLQSKLSPDGWQTVERYLNTFGGGGIAGSVISSPLGTPQQ